MTLQANFTDSTLNLSAALGETQIIQTVKPVTVTSEMTQPVGVNDNGQLFTRPTIDGQDGFSPIVEVESTAGGALIKVTDAKGKTTATPISNGINGKNGTDGYSPEIELTPTENGVQIDITTRNGGSGAFISNGADGKSAYAYAKDGGYDGTEAEFAKKLASKTSGIHIGADAPADGSDVWIDTDEIPEDENENSGNSTVVTAQPDFAANEGEDGHILNRTHYIDKDGIVHKLDNKFIDADWMATSTKQGGTIIHHTDIVFENNSAFLSENGGNFKVDPGIDVDVYWNGAKYVCALKLHDDEPYIGNGSLVFGVEDTGEPFCLYGMFLAPDIIAYVRKDTSTAENIELLVTVKSETTYNKLPKEYLPDDIGGSIDVTAEVGQTIIVKEVDENGKPTKWEAADYFDFIHEIIPLTTFTPLYEEGYGAYIYGFYGELNASNGLEVGREYTVIFDGVKYVCTAKNAAAMGMSVIFIGNGMIAGLENTGEPFVLASTIVDGAVWDGVAFLGFDGNSHTVRLTTQKIPEKYLPTNGAPYYIDATAEWDGDSGHDPTNYTFSNNPAEVAEAFTLGRTIILKVRLTTHPERFIAFYTLAGGTVATDDNGHARFMGLFVLPISTYGNTNMPALAFIGGHEAHLIVIDKGDGTLGIYSDW